MCWNSPPIPASSHPSLRITIPAQKEVLKWPSGAFRATQATVVAGEANMPFITVSTLTRPNIVFNCLFILMTWAKNHCDESANMKCKTTRVSRPFANSYYISVAIAIQKPEYHASFNCQFEIEDKFR
jgi:hypothetical protein